MTRKISDKSGALTIRHLNRNGQIISEPKQINKKMLNPFLKVQDQQSTPADFKYLNKNKKEKI